MKQHTTRSRASKTKKATLTEIEDLSLVEKITVGIDIGDRSSRYCIVNPIGATLLEGKLATTRDDLKLTLNGLAKSTTTIALEAGTHSPWISRYLTQMGFDPIVANPRRLALISETRRKNDKVDAQKLAMLAQTNARLLYPIQHRGEQAQADLAHIRSREALVQARTALISAARGRLPPGEL